MVPSGRKTMTHFLRSTISQKSTMIHHHRHPFHHQPRPLKLTGTFDADEGNKHIARTTR